MNETRQDAWTEDEDKILADTVLRFIREGQTQLEAFKEVANTLSRTSAACGFRWNATIRKQHHQAIQNAKEQRKNGFKKQTIFATTSPGDFSQSHTIDTAIKILERMRTEYPQEKQKEQEKLLERVIKENEQLKSKLAKYDRAWEEVNSAWLQVKN
ncbi:MULTISPECIES: RsfA family transcriptional regulator [Oceanobacillus]|uniref:Myb-like domain-containing protein n=1 Tax=Oceanobacillus kimchii TaxID=746691 RepID=A0ABQ5TJM4_9BACI|nr:MULTISPECIES: RsfA family transcriptional regulator [Oceanobacillus]MBT2598810.1 RsfA family transcriptional regulator [Oceanobacillus sp. ISL-74]MBT2651729.1 RsfA family transcriptional regulator [Oceanobacillus sp. ISL-73]MCT1576378.1 RsfA family transcriptional regulator [Oceanobacillus kimchii]MCT2136014.1 RsfA family transcriptional regulator [Oceanobacillus kimchii]OEH54564.1 RsfA family transcription regulator [Oceanobacillus sp. E9]